MKNLLGSIVFIIFSPSARGAAPRTGSVPRRTQHTSVARTARHRGEATASPAASNATSRARGPPLSSVRLLQRSAARGSRRSCSSRRLLAALGRIIRLGPSVLDPLVKDVKRAQDALVSDAQ